MHYPEKEWLTPQFCDSLYLLLDTLDAQEEKEAIVSAMAASEDPLEDLQVEYTRLFINGVPHVIAPPYGSVYIDRTLQGLHAEKTLRFYRNHGYDVKDNRELPDHLIHQLDFLAILSEKNDIAASNDFLQTIFLPWFPRFETRVRQEAQHPFYSVIVQLIDYLTKEDDEHGIPLDEA
jgi:TorA maturation chaperone TorD